jgi:hypothetical protein
MAKIAKIIKPKMKTEKMKVELYRQVAKKKNRE